MQKGLEHRTRSGNIIKSKTFQPQTKCSCSKKSAERILVVRQEQIFNTFYNLKNWTQKRLYLRSLIKTVPKKENLNPRKMTRCRSVYKYYLTGISGQHEEVCLPFLVNCLKITQSIVNRVARSVQTNETARDLRGRYPNRKTNPNDTRFIMSFIRKYPSYLSHYGASSSNKKYMNPNLNIRKLYAEYVELCKSKQRKLLSEWKFRDVFNKLGFGLYE